ncbi:LysR family transcriptional regulator [Bradyrhizobium sp.]|uniref:LysR family transcriptional regulator n=1 Tax=Bradyrhizobium sp. TaxID=376 RepID=UPI002D580330|nr:LysR family transcriptional regulator [Bradyrhizobium sp.]HZR76991.1 LysR family transcriptional regulator [Bradyrhizobium sp.]
MAIKLSQLRNFTAVVDAGAVRQAARMLHLSQSSVTKSIQQLEQELGVPLLHRGAQGVTPTAAGQALLGRVKAIEAQLRHARNDVEAVAGASVGEIRVSASPTVAMGLLPRGIIAFQRAHPRVTFRILEGVYPDVLPTVRTGDIDIAICLVPGRPRDETLSFISLIKDRLVPAVRSDHPLLARRKLRLADLLDLDWIIYRRSRSGLDVFEQTFVANRLPPPESTVECTSFACALALVESGNYATLVPSQIFASARRPLSIAPVMLDAPMQPWQVAAISRPEHELSAVCRAFLRELRRTAAKIGLPPDGRRRAGRSKPAA